MDAKEFKRLLGEVAAEHEFLVAHGGWYRQSSECLVVLALQKSKHGNYFELNIKIFVQGMFGQQPGPDKDTIKNQPGHIFFRPPSQYKSTLDLDTAMSSDECRKALAKLFAEYIAPATQKGLSRAGIRALSEAGLVYLLPAVEAQLVILQ